MTDFTYDVCIIGTGRVGLPLGLSLVDVGIKATGVDLDPRLAEKVNGGVMPFHEPGYDDLIASGKFTVHTDPAVAAEARALVITVGTPLHTHIETDLSQVRRVLSSIVEHLRPGQLVCLRSTVGPGTTTFAKRWIERNTDLVVGKDIGLAFCPERIAEGKAKEELRTLPQIIGAEDEMSSAMASDLFAKLTDELFQTDYVSAELVKLFNNIARYVHFAMANQFAMVADTFDANIYEIRRMANHNYPRSHLASPGLTAGTCLRKDFGMINEWNPYPDMLLSAWKMNEYIPAFLVQHLLQRTDLHDKNVAILGYTFKQDTDDTRDSLAPKLHRYIEREIPAKVTVTDHHLPELITDTGNGEVQNHSVEAALADADCVFVATNHTGYREALLELAKQSPEAWVADIWNVGEIDQVFYKAGSLLEAAT
jgi:UDP-N-acetyl-D-mannosaminuronic acid dehydrogenase